MILRHVIRQPWFPLLGAALAVCLIGIGLWLTRLGDPWIHASYDLLFRFTTRASAHRAVVIQLDNAAYSQFQETRGAWDRIWHARLVDKLTADGCSLVVFDVHFKSAKDADTDQALAQALARRQGRTVLMTEIVEPTHSGSEIMTLKPVYPPFEEQNAIGVGWLGIYRGERARRHWPFPAPESIESLSWAAARLSGADLPAEPVEQWLRYYDPEQSLARYSFHFALSKPPGFFTNSVVFIGGAPEHSDQESIEEDKFTTPWLAGAGESRAAGGVEIHAIAYLNLMNRDWLRRLPNPAELAILLVSGLLLGTLTAARTAWRFGLPIAFGLAAVVAGIWLGHATNYWFPFLIVAGAQVPGAIVIGLIRARTVPTSPPSEATAPTTAIEPPAEHPDAPDYTFVAPPFGAGGFGKVWLVRNAIGQWQALKAVYQAKFDNTKPYEAEFEGIQNYKPISASHLGLLNVDFVSTRKPEGYFYYVMELGDAAVDGWESAPASYRPLDLKAHCAGHPKNRLPVAETVRIGIQLAEALSFLHSHGLIHRDIKPANIIFVRGQPKLADVGLVAHDRAPEDISTIVGTPGYMPPPPEPPGTACADIYALGMVLFVISTGNQPKLFPDLKTSLVMNAANAEFMLLNPIILKACAADPLDRFSSAAELKAALERLQIPGTSYSQGSP